MCVCVRVYVWCVYYIYIQKKTWILGEFEGSWSTRRQGGEWGTDAWNGARTGVSERLPSQARGNVSTVSMDTSAYRCRCSTVHSRGSDDGGLLLSLLRGALGTSGSAVSDSGRSHCFFSWGGGGGEEEATGQVLLSQDDKRFQTAPFLMLYIIY
jgi:hypothetical protein